MRWLLPRLPFLVAATAAVAFPLAGTSAASHGRPHANAAVQVSCTGEHIKIVVLAPGAGGVSDVAGYSVIVENCTRHRTFRDLTVRAQQLRIPANTTAWTIRLLKPRHLAIEHFYLVPARSNDRRDTIVAAVTGKGHPGKRGRHKAAKPQVLARTRQPVQAPPPPPPCTQCCTC